MEREMELKEICNTLLEGLTARNIKDKFEVLGTGSSRVVFDAGEFVIKKAKNNIKGLLQNDTEQTMFDDAGRFESLLCPVIGSSECGTFLVMQKAMSLKKAKELSGEVKAEVNLFIKSLKKMKELHLETSNQSSKVFGYNSGLSQEEKDEIWESDLFMSIFSLIEDYSLISGDCFSATSWNYLNGEMVLIDYGLKKDDYFKHYVKINRKFH